MDGKVKLFDKNKLFLAAVKSVLENKQNNDKYEAEGNWHMKRRETLSVAHSGGTSDPCTHFNNNLIFLDEEDIQYFTEKAKRNL